MSEELDVVEPDRVFSPTAFDKAEKVEEVGILYLKGYRVSEISELTNLNKKTVNNYIDQYKAYVEKQVQDDPYFLEQTQYNTLMVLKEFDEISKEAWETVEIATRDGLVGGRNQALKLALDIAGKKAQVLQLMGGQRTDSEYIARMQKAETVNNIISNVIRDVIAHCDECRVRAAPMLKEAFAMMREADGGVETASSDLDIEDADIVD